MEFKVLTVVKFDVNCTPSQTFLENYCRAIRINIPRVLIYASYLLDLSLLKAEFLSIETSHLTLVALSIAIRREQSLSGVDFDEQYKHIDLIMDLERCSEKKLLETIKLFEKYLSPANQLAQSKAIM